MPRRSTAFVPQLRFHKASKQAYVLINGHFVYLGRAEDPEVQNRYDQTIAEWLARGRQLATHQSVIVAEVVAAYLAIRRHVLRAPRRHAKRWT